VSGPTSIPFLTLLTHFHGVRFTLSTKHESVNSNQNTHSSCPSRPLCLFLARTRTRQWDQRMPETHPLHHATIGRLNRKLMTTRSPDLSFSNSGSAADVSLLYATAKLSQVSPDNSYERHDVYRIEETTKFGNTDSQPVIYRSQLAASECPTRKQRGRAIGKVSRRGWQR
jgi:hypothetical protein